jgi:hypothetical protein
MSMEGPGPSRQERSVESIPTKEEVLLEIAKHCENPTIKRELSDEKGVYLLEAEVRRNYRIYLPAQRRVFQRQQSGRNYNKCRLF